MVPLPEVGEAVWGAVCVGAELAEVGMTLSS